MAWKKKSSSSSTAVASVPFFSLFKYADAFDILLMVIGSLAAIINGFAYPAMILTRGQIIDNFGQSQVVDKSGVMTKVSNNSLVFVYIALVAWLASYLEVSCWMRSGERQAARIRLKYLRSILRQDVEFFEAGGASTSDVANSISADTMLVQEAISEKAGNFIRNASQFLGCYLVGFTQAWRLSVVLLPFTPFMVLPGILYGKVIAKFEFQKQGTYNKAGRIAEEAISSIRTVYSFVGESKTLADYRQSLEPTVKLGLKQGFAKGLALASGGITFAIWSFLAWYGSTLVKRGQANGAEVITTGLAFINGGRALGFAVSNVKIFAEGRVAAAKIYQIISRVPSIDIDACQGKQLTEVAGRLQLRNVEYSYACRPDIPVLKGLTLDIPEGKKLALVGSSGSGKSTIIALLERFYDPAQGTVLLDGTDIRTLQLRWYRSQIGLVSQEPALFATSIKDNILYGKEDATMDEVAEAAKLSNAHSFIASFPDGYETQVGERGVQLSGGQKQRIAIARALIKKPPILLLDEATSALDTESEAVVQAALEEASAGRTTAIVAHRLSTIRNADIIAVLESGKLVEMGKHEELIDKGGAYAALASLQATALPRRRSMERYSSQEKIERYNSQEKVGRYSSLGRFSSQEMRKILDVFSGRKSRRQQVEVDSSLPETKEEQKELKEPKASFWNLASLCKPEWKQCCKGLIGAIVFGLIQPVYSFLFGAMVTVYYDRNYHRMDRKIQHFSLMFAGIAAATFISNLVNHYNFATVGELLTKRVRELMLASILTFEVGWFDRDENTSGAVCSRLQNEANMIRALIIDRISLIVQTFSAVCTSFVMGLVVSWRMGLLMVALQPLLVFCYYIKLVFLKGFTKKAAKAQEDASHIASEAVSLHRTVTAFSSQDRVLDFMQSRLQAAIKDNKKRANMAGFGLGLAHFVLYASWGLQFWFGGKLFVHGKASLQDVFQVFFVFLSTGRVLAEALSLTPDLAKGPAAIEAVFSIINRKTEIDPDDKKLEKPSKLRGALELCNVNFAYPSRPDIMIFSNFSLRVRAGKTVALVGQSGSGKSTVIGLVERFYDPLQGVVKIDGRDIKSLHLRTLRRKIGLVGQEPTLFASTILDNITYGLEEGSWKMDEVVEAAKVANAHNFISALPEGYATYAGEKGLQLSGGQKQRIAIARAVLKNPTILLLDEATSALDTESEHLVQEALNRIMVGRTTVIIAHRLSTIKGCDSIAVVQNGAIVEEGTHEELLAKGERGAYYSLVHLQQQSSVA